MNTVSKRWYNTAPSAVWYYVNEATGHVIGSVHPLDEADFYKVVYGAMKEARFKGLANAKRAIESELAFQNLQD